MQRSRMSLSVALHAHFPNCYTLQSNYKESKTFYLASFQFKIRKMSQDIKVCLFFIQYSIRQSKETAIFLIKEVGVLAFPLFYPDETVECRHSQVFLLEWSCTYS